MSRTEIIVTYPMGIRSGGYMEFDGYASYGRCGIKKDAEAIITNYFNSKQLF